MAEKILNLLNKLSTDNETSDRFSRNNVRNRPVSSQMSRGTWILQGGAFTLYVNSPKIVIRGMVANIRGKESHGRYRIGARILSIDPPYPLLPQFIAQRQAEIVKEIRLMGELLAKNAWK